MSELDGLDELIHGAVAADNAKEAAVIEVAEDKMSATISFSRPGEGGDYLTIEEIQAMISAEGIVNGIDNELLEMLALPTKTYDYAIEFCHGTDPVPSKDAYIEYTYDPNSEVNVPQAKEDGSVDLFNLNLIQNVKKDEVLATLHPMEEGQDGVDIFGNPVPVQPGKPALLSCGKGAFVSEDGSQVIAEMDGQLIYDNGKITIQNIYEVQGDVDASTGNITFLGSVSVKGSIKSGFKVVADGNVEVAGVVEAAEVEAGGDVIVTGGVQGNKVGHIKAKGNVVSKFLENSKVEATGDVVADAIMHSEVKCSGMVKAEGKKGLIVGGVIDAYKGIRAKTIGSHMATATELNVGTSIELGEKFKEIQEALANKKKDLLQAEQIINILAAKRRELGGLPGDKEDMLFKSLKTREYLICVIPTLESKLNELRDVIDHINRYSIEATDTIFTGVKVNIANEKKIISEELTHARLTKKDGEIKVDIL
ncbi:MAG: FapA family protein [Clostridia bacterium]|nr:FapA family protein [Clostridia bacterium]